MGKNSDTSNIFSSYMDNVLLKEAVRSTEVEGTATSQAEKDPKWVQAKTAWENMTGKKLDQMPANQRISISQNVLKPAAQKGYLENPDTKERTPISGGESAAQSAPTTTPAPQQPAAQPAPVSQPAPQAAPAPSPAEPQQTKATVPPPAEEAPKPSAVATPPPQDQNVPEKRAENPYTTEYQGPSIVDFLAKSGQKSDMASRQALAQRMGIQNYKGTAEQNTQMLNALKKQAQDFAKTPQVATPAQVSQAQQPATTSPEKPLQVGNVSIGKPSGTAPTPPSQTSIPTQQPVNVGGGITIGNPTGSQNEPTKTSQVASTQKPAKPEASEEEANEENCEDCENNCEKCKKNKSNALNKITVQEKVNISKFLKHLSEKNYSSAHKYLKAIVDDKVNAKIAQRIAKI